MSKSNHSVSIATKLAQALRYMDTETGAVTPAIQPATTYARDENYGIRKPFWYRRDGNPTTEHAERLLAELECAADVMLFASGMSAATAVIEHLPPDAHVVVPDVMYHGVVQQFEDFSNRGRLRVDQYAAGDLADLKQKIRPQETALVWVETPNNPDWTVTDIAQAADIAHAAGAKLLTDCTATAPCATQALALGADFSFHSATKYLAGHSDVTAGSLAVRVQDDGWEKIAQIRKLQGTVLHSFDAWLLIRGMRTLLLRYQRASENALGLARHFQNDPRVKAVLYPGLESHPGHETAKRQTGGQFGGMLSIIVNGPEAKAIDVARFCQVFYPATSLGGVESLIEHRKTVSGEGFKVDPSLLRISVGIEDIEDLIADLDQALDRALS